MDDDDGVRDSVRRVLEDAGDHVADAEDGQQALESFRASAERLAVPLDNAMPTLDGAVLLDVAAAGVFPARRGDVLVTASPNVVPPATHCLLALLDVPLIR